MVICSLNVYYMFSIQKIEVRRDKLANQMYKPIKCVIAQKFTFMMWILNYTV